MDEEVEREGKQSEKRLREYYEIRNICDASDGEREREEKTNSLKFIFYSNLL